MIKDCVSVIIPSFNNADFLPECIESALSQDYSNKEIIVIDDGSTDNTKALLSQYANKVNFIYKQNGGPASARNFGIRHSCGEYVAFLDADDIWFSNKLSAQIEYMKAHKEIGLCFTNFTFRQDTEELRYSEINRMLNSKNLFNELLKGNFINTSTVILRRELLDISGTFDEDPRLISVEDYNLWLRLSRICKFGFLKEVLVIRRNHPKSLSYNFEKMYKADLYNFEKIMSEFPEWNLSNNKNYKRGYANYLYKFGDEYFYRKQYKQAKNFLARSLQVHPFNIKALLRFGLTLFPDGILNSLRKAKNV